MNRYQATRGHDGRAMARRDVPVANRMKEITRMGFAVSCVVVLVLSLVPAGSGDVPGVQEAFRITSDSAGTSKRLEAFDTVTIAVFDLDGDGVKEIIAHNDNNNVYVFSGVDGSLVAELETNHPDGWNVRELAGISVGDVNGNGRPDLVVANSAGWLTVFEASPSGEGGMTFDRLWERYMDPNREDPDYSSKHGLPEDVRPGLDGSAYLADATGDGSDEIFLQLDDVPGMYALTGDGEVYGWADWSDGNANPIATDLTGDGRIEVVFPSDGGILAVFDGEGFFTRCVFSARDFGADPASISVAPTVVDLTGDGRKEIVFGARNAVEDEDDPEWHQKQSAHYFAVTSDCEALWHVQPEWSNPHVHMHPIPVDVTGNGQLDVVFQDWNTVGQKPGSWQVTGRPNLFAVEGGTGELIWREQTHGFWSNKNLALADVTGDGQQELLVNDEIDGTDGIALYGLDGDRSAFFADPGGWNVNRGPSVVDLDGDGELEIILPLMRGSDHCTRNLDVGCREGALQVYSTTGTGNPVWPNVKYYNHAYDDEGVEPGAEVDLEPEPERDPGNESADETAGNGTDDGSDVNETQGVEAEAANGTTEADDSSGFAPGGGGGAGGGADSADPGPEQMEEDTPDPPVITFGEGFPDPGQPHDPMAPLVVQVSGNSTVESVTMELGQQTLGVDFDGETAQHVPQEPLPAGNHTLRVTATDVDGVSASRKADLWIAQDEPLQPQDPVDEPRFGEGPADAEPERSTPAGGVVALVLGALAVIAVLRRRIR